MTITGIAAIGAGLAAIGAGIGIGTNWWVSNGSHGAPTRDARKNSILGIDPSSLRRSSSTFWCCCCFLTRVKRIDHRSNGWLLLWF